MKPILKWTGGKASEIQIIKPFFPKEINTFIEPFVGGGAVYFDLEHEKNIINDFNNELILFYKIIQNNNLLYEFTQLFDIYEVQLNTIKQIENIEEEGLLLIDDNIWRKIFTKEYASKNKLINRIKLTGEISEFDEKEHIKTALYASLYYYYRQKYNDELTSFSINHIFYWFLMRELSYSGMFRYNTNGKFNVPYGGLSYNKKDINKKINYAKFMHEKSFFQNTVMENLDFETLFEKYGFFTDSDFIFLDQPYDSEFSKYNSNDFTKDDQIRLYKNCLKLNSKFMMVVKDTEFIKDLYKDNFYMQNFPKKYSVNFRNRNNQDASHLIITNYKIEME